MVRSEGGTSLGTPKAAGDRAAFSRESASVPVTHRFNPSMGSDTLSDLKLRPSQVDPSGGWDTNQYDPIWSIGRQVRDPRRIVALSPR